MISILKKSFSHRLLILLGLGISLSVSSQIQANPELVADIAALPVPQHSNPEQIFHANGLTYFRASTRQTGQELWVTNGSDTWMLMDMAPGERGSYPVPVGVLNGEFYFRASVDGTSKLLKTDGTVAGTEVVAEITILIDHNQYSAVEMGGALYFAGYDGSNGYELWKTDGTAAGTLMVKDVFAAEGSSQPRLLTRAGSTLFFAANDGVNGEELWKSDGTEAGTELVKDVFPGINTSNLYELTAVGTTLFFRAYDDVNGYELWKSDGTETGTVMVKDIYPGTNYGSPFSSTPQYLTEMGGELYFMASDATHGRELWKSDGTEIGTVLVKDIVAGSSSAYIKDLISFNGVLYFMADDLGYSSQLDLWKSDGTEAGTVLVADINQYSSGSDPIEFTEVAGTLFFRGRDTSNQFVLWKTDGTTLGTSVVHAFTDFTGYSGDPWYLTAAGNELIFRASDAVHGMELWSSDGTAAGTGVLANIRPDVGDGYPQQMVEMNGIYYFTATDKDHGYGELWATDGVNTWLVADVWEGTSGSGINNLAVMSNHLYFSARGDGTTGAELWKSDGTAAGTVMVKDINTTSRRDSYPRGLTVFNNRLYFQADDGVNGNELWTSDGTAAGTYLLKDIYPGTRFFDYGNSSYPQYFTVFGNYLYFVAEDPTNGYEIWRTDGTPAGTQVAMDLAPGRGSARANNLKVFNGALFFSMSLGGAGTELWKSDGTVAGTTLVKDIYPGSQGSSPNSFTILGGTLFFRANDGASGYELWKTDGTETGTVLVKDIQPGSASSNPNFLVVVGNELYFAANDGVFGQELWYTDGTEAGTHMAFDLVPGVTSSFVQPLAAMGDDLFFSADDGVVGQELWKFNTLRFPDINLNPAVLDFGNVNVGLESSLSSALENLGDAALDISSVALCAGTSSEFSITPLATSRVAVASSIPLEIIYTPEDAGTDTGCIEINSNDPDEATITITVSGSGLTYSDINLNPPSLDFGAVDVGLSGTLSTTLENFGNASLNISQVSLCAGTSSEFSVTPLPVSTIGAFSTQNLQVHYTPVDAGIDTGCIEISSNDPDEAVVTLNVSGAGQTVFTGTGIMGDYVWEDLNGDGVQNTNEPGLVNVSVELQSCDGSVLGVRVTDTAGYYQFTDLAAGNYRLRYITPANFAFTGLKQGSDFRMDSNADPITGLTPCVSIADQTRRLALDAGMVRNDVGGTGIMGDFVWEDQNGNGIQDVGEPGMADVEVQLQSCTGALIRTLTTGVNGGFQFTHLAPGQYQMHYRLPQGYAFSPKHRGGNYRYDSNADPVSGLSPCFSIADGQQRLAIDAGMVPSNPAGGSAAMGDYVWSDDNGNGIQDANESGLAGVTVHLLNCSNNLLSVTSTDANGHFLFDQLAAGSYRLRYQLMDGYSFSAAGQGSDNRYDSNANPNSGLSPCLTLVDGQLRLALDAGMVPNRPVVGTGAMGDFVWSDTNGNGVQETGEPGLAGVTVQLLTCSNEVLNTTTSGADGRFLFDQLAIGNYRLRYTLLPGYVFSPAGQGGDVRFDSNVVTSTGLTPCLSIVDGQRRIALDAGMVPR